VGEVTARRLHEHGIRTIGQLAALPAQTMKALFGAAAEEMHRRALGIDDSPVGHGGQRKSVSQERTFAHDVGDLTALRRSLLGMSEDVASHLRRHGECARIVVLKLRYPNFKTITRRVTLKQPTDLAEVLHARAVQLLEREWKRGMQVRLIGVGATGLVQARQLSLFEDRTEVLSKLSQAVDGIRDKYGDDAIRRASLLKPRQARPRSGRPASNDK
jgi:DNA polymerase-4